MNLKSNTFYTKNKKYLQLLYLLFFAILSCKKDQNSDKITANTQTDSIQSEDGKAIDNRTQDQIAEKEKYIEFITEFLDQKENKSIDSLNVKVEKAMEIYNYPDIYEDKDLMAINDQLVTYIENQNDLKIAESFYTAGLLESYGYFSMADGHAINRFKEGAKLGSVNCVKYLAIIYFERILYKHNANDYCDPVCMFSRGKNYIEETSLASLNKNDILKFTSVSDNFFLKTISDHINKKMTDDEISNYVLYLRTHNNPIFKINDLKIKDTFTNLIAASEINNSTENVEEFINLLNNNPNINVSDIAELFTFNYPAYQNDDKFLFWLRLDLDKKNINTLDQFEEDYDLDTKYGLTDYGSKKIYTGILQYFSDKGDEKSEGLLAESNQN